MEMIKKEIDRNIQPSAVKLVEMKLKLIGIRK